ncbi:MAG: glycosyltransferase family 25 protein [Deltaproteobacteria bacterium]|nr:glycosyltransferase family 25 protein [Deltaproteobacteria bacterium]
MVLSVAVCAPFCPRGYANDYLNAVHRATGNQRRRARVDTRRFVLMDNMRSVCHHALVGSMRIVVINLKRAGERRERMAREFAAVSLPYEIKEAIDGRLLSDDQLSQVDWEGRRRLGLYPPADGGIANWLTQREAMQDLVESGPDMMAVFEDDVRLEPDLPVVLAALEGRTFDFGVVALQRRHPRRRFLPCIALTERHTAGRVRYSDSGSDGYVITRTAARHLLDTTPKMVLSTDHAVLRYWANGLNVFYVDPPVVHHGGYENTFIGTDRTVSRRLRTESDYTVGFWRRAVTGVSRSVQKHIAFRRLVNEDRRNAALPLAKRA